MEVGSWKTWGRAGPLAPDSTGGGTAAQTPAVGLGLPVASSRNVPSSRCDRDRGQGGAQREGAPRKQQGPQAPVHINITAQGLERRLMESSAAELVNGFLSCQRL